MEVNADIATALQERGVQSVYHFTTSRGLIGIVAQGALRARAHLSEDSYLEHVYTPNSNFRREAPRFWTYVNLSISEINERFFAISQRWHSQNTSLHWLILEFSAEILTHEGVLFSPTNMAYDGVTAKGGVEAFDALFAETVPSGFGNLSQRASSLDPEFCTDRQAEALYPDAVSTRFLRRILVREGGDAANVEAIVGVLGHDEVEIAVLPDLF